MSQPFSKPRICHITSAHPADDIRIFHKQCVTLAETGYEVHLVATGTLLTNAKGVIHHVIPMNQQCSRLKRMLFRSWKAYRLAKRTEALVFHFHDPELLPYGLLLKWQGYRVIYDAHEDLPRDVMTKRWIPLILRKAVAVLIEKVEDFIARRLDKVICATPFIAKRFQDAGANATYVRNFPHLAESKVDFTQNERPSICYVGVISPQRGIVEMIQAIEPLDVRLILAGRFVDSKTETLVRSLPGWEKVDYRGVVLHQGVRDIFAKSSLGLCVLHASQTHNESLPIKLFEYMEAGLPVLASNFLAWEPIVNQAMCGFCIDPLDIVEIRCKILWFLSHVEEAKQMGLRGRLAAEEVYNWGMEKKRLLDVYEQILGAAA